MKVNRAPFNLVPQKWAFDPEIGPFIRDILDMLFQLRVRTGGDGDDVNNVTYYAIAGTHTTSGNEVVEATGATNVITLNANPLSQEFVTVKRNTEGTVTVEGGSRNIDGLSDYKLLFNYESKNFIYSDTSDIWLVV